MQYHSFSEKLQRHFQKVFKSTSNYGRERRSRCFLFSDTALTEEIHIPVTDHFDKTHKRLLFHVKGCKCIHAFLSYFGDQAYMPKLDVAFKKIDKVAGAARIYC